MFTNKERRNRKYIPKDKPAYENQNDQHKFPTDFNQMTPVMFLDSIGEEELLYNKGEIPIQT